MDIANTLFVNHIFASRFFSHPDFVQHLGNLSSQLQSSIFSQKHYAKTVKICKFSTITNGGPLYKKNKWGIHV